MGLQRVRHDWETFNSLHFPSRLSFGIQDRPLWLKGSRGHRLSSCCSQAWLLSCLVVCGILVPWPGVKLTSPILEGRFLKTQLPGNEMGYIFKNRNYHCASLLVEVTRVWWSVWFPHVCKCKAMRQWRVVVKSTTELRPLGSSSDVCAISTM